MNNTDKVIVVAEITTNHLGDIERLKKMAWLAKEAGADLIKIQKRNVPTFYPPEKLEEPFESPFGKTWGDLRHQLELSLEEIIEFENECKNIGIDWFASVLDWESFELLRHLEKGLIKLPSTVSKHTDYHARVAEQYDGPIVVSTGYTSQEYEAYVLKTFGNNERIYLLQCTSAYPTPPEDCSVSVVRHYHHLRKMNPKIVPGYSSHDNGSLGCMLAVAAGAKMIEKHVKLGHTPWMFFQDVALDLENEEFKKFVDDIRLAEKMCGDEAKSIKSSEWHKYTYVPKVN